jgi:hypothetical protein
VVRKPLGSPAKKLEAAARHWARGGSGQAAPVDDEELAAWGITRADLPDEEPDEDTRFEVFPENWEAAQLFLRLFSQWRVGSMGGFLGLEYPGVEVVLKRARASDPDDIFVKIQIMEQAALPVLNEQYKLRTKK